MNTSRKAVIRYGHPELDPGERVAVPVGLAGALSSRKIEFNTLHDVCNHQVSQLNRCDVCDTVVGKDALLKGYRNGDGYVTFTEQEIKDAVERRSSNIDVTKFVPSVEVVEAPYDKRYWLVPDEHVEGPYGVLCHALVSLKAAGLGVQSLWGVEHPVAIYPVRLPEHLVLMMAVLHPWEDWVSPDFTAPIPSKAGAAEGKERVSALMGHLEPEDLVSESRNRVTALLNERLLGGVPVAPDLVGELKVRVKKRAVKP